MEAAMRGVEKRMSETVFAVSLEIVAAVLAASFFVVDCLRQEAAAAIRVAVGKQRR
jgi:hypothetical protein